VAYAAVLLIDLQVTLASRKQELAELQQKYEEKRIANKELELQLQQGMDEEYVERIAREKLDYVAPDEKVYIDISGS
jgi:cell division protein FtsB